MRRGVAAVAGLALALTACGGGGGGDDATTPAVTTPAVTADPTPDATPEPTATLSQEEIDTEAALARTEEYVALYWELKDGDWQDQGGRDEIMAMTAPEWQPSLQLEIDNYLYNGITGSGMATAENFRATNYQTTDSGTYVDVAFCQDPAGVEMLSHGGPIEGLTFFRAEITYRLRIMPDDPEREPLVQSITTGGDC